MKILMISTPYQPTVNIGSNGLGRLVYDYAHRASMEGDQVTVFCREGSILPEGVRSHYWAHEPIDIGRVHNICRKEKYDVILDCSHLKILSNIYAYENMPVVNFMLDEECNYQPKNMLICNDHQKKRYKDYRFMIDIGIEFERYPLIEEKEDYFCFCAKIEKRKGYDIAIEVAKRTGIKLILAGPQVHWQPESAEGLPNWIGEITEHEKFCKFVGGAKAIFCPSRNDAGGLVLLEAAALGTPVITTTHSGAQHHTLDGQTGFVCDSIEDMCRAVTGIENLTPKDIRTTARKKWDLQSNFAAFRNVLAQVSEEYKGANK
tara:strand:+ start:715 stop:1668 length:954 start_codon:yes stop_codon:yes gene_type:complete